jgi:phosphotransferase system IIA component
MADVDFILKPMGDKIVVCPDKRILSSVIILLSNFVETRHALSL